MARRAVIYIRTSSETQGEKSSPIEQEMDCRRLAEEKGMKVIRVYRDVEKYRVGNKLVEPSGSRSDRPGLLSMLKDASRDEFDINLAWREDRLYRGLRSMLLVLETIQEYKIEILLAKETFDPKIAPVHARAAQMELDGMKERMAMGVREYAYGYKEQSRDGEIYQIPVEPIIDIPTYELFRTQREKNKTNSPQQSRHDYLLSGHLKCSVT